MALALSVLSELLRGFAATYGSFGIDNAALCGIEMLHNTSSLDFRVLGLARCFCVSVVWNGILEAWEVGLLFVIAAVQ